MKKLQRGLICLAGAVLLFALAACGGKQEEAKAFTTADLKTAVEAGAFSEELEELDGDVAFALYQLAAAGLDREALTDCAVLRSAGATCEEGAVLVFTDAQTAQTAQTAMEGYLEDQMDSNRDYRPNEIPKLENALLERRENTVLLLVAADLDAAKKALELS